MVVSWFCIVLISCQKMVKRGSTQRCSVYRHRRGNKIFTFNKLTVLEISLIFDNVSINRCSFSWNDHIHQFLFVWSELQFLCCVKTCDCNLSKSYQHVNCDCSELVSEKSQLCLCFFVQMCPFFINVPPEPAGSSWTVVTVQV